MLSEEQVKKFQEIYQEETGREIDADEALAKATKLIAIFELVCGLSEKENNQNIKINF